MLPKISFFGYIISTYPVMVFVSSVTGLFLLVYNLIKDDYKWSFVLKMILGIIIGFFTFARLLNVLLHLDYYRLAPSLIFRFQLKGFSVLGGMIGASCVCLFLLWREKKDFKRFFDITVIPFFTGFFLMKIGCFLNGCCGGKITASCLGVSFPTSPAASNPMKMLDFVSGLLMIPKAVFPTQLFESFAALIFIPVVLLIRRKNLATGKLFIISAIYFLCFRLVIHFFRDFPYPPVVVNIIYPAIYVALIATLVFCYFWIYRKSTKSA